MDMNVLFGLEPLQLKVAGYNIRKDGYVVTVFRSTGRPFGRITLSPSGEHRGALWLRDSLAGEFQYFRRRWYVYPIEQGRLARHAQNIHPLLYLIDRFKATSARAGTAKAKLEN